LLQNNTDLQTEITTHCPIIRFNPLYVRIRPAIESRPINKVEKNFPGVSGGGLSFL